ncbi:MAG: hypothetical protein IPL49_16550 [Saprospirales bacterium]|nr:hypothetical protein [Saprospirales bacterium]MBK8492445.1 hypothetical protein [Saprospirales bacterium]
MKKFISYPAAFILAAFGVLTLFLSSSIIFDLFDIREKEGNFVWIVVGANFIASILYLLAAYGFLKNRRSTATLLGASLLVLVAAAIGFYFHINSGGLYETKTIGALTFRIMLTLIFTLIAFFTITKKSN